MSEPSDTDETASEATDNEQVDIAEGDESPSEQQPETSISEEQPKSAEVKDDEITDTDEEDASPSEQQSDQSPNESDLEASGTTKEERADTTEGDDSPSEQHSDSSTTEEQLDGGHTRTATAGPITKARGLPAIWSALLGLPFIFGGGYVWLGETTAPPEAGIPILTFGVFVLGVGTYIHFVAAPEPPTMREGEEIIDTRNPAQRAAAAKAITGFFFLLGAGYLLFFTFHPYVYPTITGFVGLYFFSTGLYTYWTNTLTTYYVTNRRIIKEYRFISLVRQELPFGKIRGVEERKSVWEALVGLGNVRVASGGGGGTLEIVVRNVYSPTEFADEIRNLL